MPSSGDKRKTSPSVEGSSVSENNDESDDDDEVEVLLTILPPTPKRVKQTESGEMETEATQDKAPGSSRLAQSDDDTEPPHNDNEHPGSTSLGATMRTDEPHIDSFVAHTSESAKLPTSASLESVSSSHNETSAQDAASQEDQTPQPQYTFQSSAYVQNLAEICYTILHDRRWRVEGEARKQLFGVGKGR